MIYISCDIETTGLDRDNHKILSIGAIVEDTSKKLPLNEIPKFHCALLHDELNGSPFAINMNKDLIGMISEYQISTDDKRKELSDKNGIVFLHPYDVVENFYYFLYDAGIFAKPDNCSLQGRNGKFYPMIDRNSPVLHLSFAGKNFGTFDKLFLEQLPRWKQLIRIKQRIIDPSILFVDWKNDSELPNLQKCKDRAGLDGIVTHNALEDAWDIIELLRKSY